jgi:hypothetical protein
MSWHLVAAAFFMFVTSTLYHAVRRPTAKAALRRLDHSTIYLLIAGTYAPFTLGVVRGSVGWVLFGVVWTLAVVGVIVKLTGAMSRIPWDSTLIYVDWLDRVSGLQATRGQSDGNAVRVADCRSPVLHRMCALLFAEKPAVCARRPASFRVGWRCLSFRGHT